MVETPPSSIAVVGAAGFVGRALLRELERREIRVTAVVRGAAELSLDGSFHQASEPAEVDGEFATVINLAYPNSGPPYGHPTQNAEIVSTVNRLVRDGGRLIHVSSQAVFGMALDRPVRHGPVRRVRDDPYVESKIAAEVAFVSEQAARQLSLDIIRLGNVFGHASGAWGVPIVQRLLTGRAVGIAGHDGLSNTTDVVNAASYLAHLLHRDESEQTVRYHHLAEFSKVPWKQWIEPIADAMSVAPVYARASSVRLPDTWRQEVLGGLASFGPRSIYRSVVGERVVGSWSRSMLRGLPTSVFERAKGHDLVFAQETPLPRAEQTFLAIMACNQEFESFVDSGWTPSLNWEGSLERFLGWLARN